MGRGSTQQQSEGSAREESKLVCTFGDTYELVETLGSTETGGACADHEGLYFGGGHVGQD